MPNITITSPFHLLLFQIQHYNARANNARNLNERIFCREQLYHVKMSLKAYLN